MGPKPERIPYAKSPPCLSWAYSLLWSIFLWHMHPVSLFLFFPWKGPPGVVCGLGSCGSTSRASGFKPGGQASSALPSAEPHRDGGRGNRMLRL